MLFSRIAILSTVFCVSVGAFSAASAADFRTNADANPEQDQISATMTKKLPVAEVVGKLLGTGTIIKYNYKAAILTNSHVLEGSTSAMVRLFPNKPVRMPVIFDSPIYDIAVLDADAVVSPKEKARLLSVAANGFCTQTDATEKATCKAATQFDFRSRNDIDRHGRLAIAENGKARGIDILSPSTVWMLKDFFISGYFDDVFVAPIYLRPGASGGALFCGGDRYCGLITKVSAAGEPMTLAIPENDIQAALESPPQGGQWIKGTKGMALEYVNGPNTLVVGESTNQYASAGGELSNGGGELSNGGGELSNGGGELSNGGGELSNGAGHRNSKYWQIHVKDSNYRIQDTQLIWYYRSRVVETLSPFLDSDTGIAVNGQPISFFEIQMPPPDNAYAVMDAGLSIFNYFISKAQSVTPRIKGPLASQFLLSIRDKAATTVFRFARLYRFDTPTELTLLNDNCNTTGGDNAQAFDSKYDRVETNPGTLQYDPTSCQNKWAQYGVDASGFSKGVPFRIHQDPKLAADLKFNDETNREVEVVISNNLSTITLTGSKLNVKLVRDAKHVSASQFYKSSDPKSGLEAVAVYNTEDLTKLNRLLIRTPKRMIELITCTPGLDCSG